MTLDIPPEWSIKRVATPLCPEALPVLSLSRDQGMIPDPAWLDRWPTRADILVHGSVPPAYQAWRTRQVLDNITAMQWGLPRGGMPGHWLIVGAGPGANPAIEADYRLAINTALELAPAADLWLVADALRPSNSWGAVLGDWLARNAEAVSHATLVARLAANAEVCRAARVCHYYRPCTREHQDIIEPWIVQSLPCFIDGHQSLPAALHVASWLGAERITITGCPQGMPEDAQRYYASGAPVPVGRMHESRQILVHGSRGLVTTTQEHLIALEQADAVCYWLRCAGIEIIDASGGCIYRYAEVA